MHNVVSACPALPGHPVGTSCFSLRGWFHWWFWSQCFCTLLLGLVCSMHLCNHGLMLGLALLQQLFALLQHLLLPKKVLLLGNMHLSAWRCCQCHPIHNIHFVRCCVSKLQWQCILDKTIESVIGSLHGCCSCCLGLTRFWFANCILALHHWLPCQGGEGQVVRIIGTGRGRGLGEDMVPGPIAEKGGTLGWTVVASLLALCQTMKGIIDCLIVQPCAAFCNRQPLLGLVLHGGRIASYSCRYHSRKADIATCSPAPSAFSL